MYTMTYETFKKQIKLVLDGAFCDAGYRLESIKVPPVNGKERDAFSLKKEGTMAAPVIYLNEEFERFSNSGKTFTQYVDALVPALCRSIQDTPDARKLNCLFDPDYVRRNVVLRVVNAEKNKNMLFNLPHYAWQDLAAYCYVVVEERDDGATAGMKVTHKLLAKLGMTASELYRAAYKNTREKGFKLFRMADLNPLFAMVGDGAPMLICSNEHVNRGANFVLYEENLKKASALLGGDIVIFPSSVNEVICIPDVAGDADELLDIVREVNRTQVADDEQLSDNCYRYIAAENRVVMVSK